MSSSKQDRQGARTPADLERKYGFGKTFAEVYGLVEGAQKSADDAKVYVDKLDNSLTQEEIFNRLTANGAAQGLYMEDGDLYINAKYIANVAALFVEKIISPVDEGVFIDMANGDISAKTLRNTDTNSKVDIGTDGTTSEGLFLYRDDIFRMMLATQPYEQAFSGFRDWLLTRDDLYIQAADNENGEVCRVILKRSKDGVGSIEFAIDGVVRGSIDVNGWHGNVPVTEVHGMAAYIVESGTSGYWEYRKWSDGTYECWCTTTDNMPCTAAWGSLYVTSACVQVTFPVTFDSIPNVQYSVDGGSYYSVMPIQSTHLNSTTKSLGLKFVRPTSESSISATVNWYVRGKVTT